METDEILPVRHWLDREKELDVLDDRAELMEQKPYGRMGRIWSDVLMWLVFEHIMFDKICANFFHLSYSLLNLISMLMLQKNKSIWKRVANENLLPVLSKSLIHKSCQRILSFNVLCISRHVN